MGFYACIVRAIWNDDKFPFVSDDCQLAFFHLCTTPLGSQFGLFKSGLGGLADDKRWPVERYREAFHEGIGEGFWEYDEKHLLVWIPRFPVYNPPNSKNVVISWGRQWKELPDCELKTKCYHVLKGVCDGKGDAFAKAFAMAFGMAPVLYTGSETETEAETGEGEKGREQERKRPAPSPAQLLDTKPTEPPKDFTARQREVWKALRTAQFKVPGAGQQTAWENAKDPVGLARDLGGPAYPAVDVNLIYRLASWSQESPKRKKKLNLFLRNRFSASQEKGGGPPARDNGGPPIGGDDLAKKVRTIK
jgi:hypothetical protein